LNDSLALPDTEYLCWTECGDTTWRKNWINIGGSFYYLAVFLFNQFID